MKSRLFFALSVVCWTLPLAALASENAQLKIVSCSVETNLKGDWLVVLKARNIGGSPIKTNISSLPWGIRGNLELAAIPIRDEANPIEQIFYFDDPRVDPILVQPDSIVEGKVNLSQRLPKLSEAVRLDPTVVGWRITRGTELFGGKRVTGIVLLSTENASCFVQ